MIAEEKDRGRFADDDGRAPLGLFDSHAHLEMGQFERDREAVVARALAAGVEYILTVGSSLPSSRRAIEIARRHPGVFAAVGVHPHESRAMGKRTVSHLSKLTKSEKVVAVGEIGLDYYRNYSPRDLQQNRFREQLGLARTLSLPVIVHNRAAERDLLSILREENAWEIRGIIHCFTGDYELAKEFLDLGFFISLAGPLTFEKSAALREAVKRLPLEAFLLETDAPYLAPHPHRGRRNEPAYLRYTAQSLAELKGLSLEDVARVTTLNARALLGLGPSEKAGKIAYKIRDSLYLNVTNRCTNCCFFCARFFTDYVKGHNLKLGREPSAEEMLEAVGDPTGYREIVFCGYGEPTLRLEVVKEVARRLKERGAGKVRLNTNGLGNLIHGRNILPELQGLIDALSVSLNAENEAKYLKVCNPEFGERSYSKVKEFIREAKAYIPEVGVTVVDMPGYIDIGECERIAREELGVSFRLREYNNVG